MMWEHGLPYLFSRIAAVEQHTREEFRCNHTLKCQLWLLEDHQKQ